MSLICWWPLNGDTKNYGTLGGEIEVTASSPVYTNGKTGQALYTGTLNLTAEQWKKIIGNTISIAMWIYTRDDGSYSAGTPFFGMSGMAAPNNRKFSMFHYDKKTNLHCSWQHDNSDKTYWGCHYADFFELNKWVHLCVVQDAAQETITVYRNGVQYSKSVVSGLASMNFKSAGAAPVRAGIDYQHMNDIRIYDHALSAAEVKELSKALVVHYTFDDVLAEPTTNLLPASMQSMTVNSAPGVYGNPATINITSGLTNGSDYTLSVWQTVSSANQSTGVSTRLICYYTDGTYDDNSTTKMGITLPQDDKEYYYEITVITNKNKTISHLGGWILDHSSGYGKVRSYRNAQIEAKDHATPYTPSSRESMLMNETGLNQPTTLKNIGLTTDSCVGNFAFQSNSSYIVQDSTGDGEHGALASMWIKMPLTSNWIAFVDSSSKLGFGYYNGYGIIASTNGTNKRRVSNLNSLWNTNEWNHVVVTMDSSNTINRCWINGVEGSYSGSDHWTHTNNSFVIGSRYNSTYGEYSSTAKIDDFRLYYTCPGDDEIVNVVQDLYKTKAMITDKGDIETCQFIEGKTQAQVTSKYCFEVDECYEDFDIGNGYERVEYLEFSEAEYIDTGLAFPDANIPIIIETEVVKTAITSNDCLAGCGNGSSWYGPVMLNFHNYTLEFGVNGYATASDGSGSIALNERMFIRAEIYTNGSDHKWYKNGNIINLGTKAYQNRTSSNSTLYIGAFHHETGNSIANGSCWIGRLYSFKIWYGNSIRFLVPVKRISDQALGLYDTVEGGFYQNIGSGTLKSGPGINKNEAKIYQDKYVLGRNIIEF